MYKFLLKNNHTCISVLLFIFVYAIIIIIKPRFLFNNDGSIRDFGLGRTKKTILPMWLLAIILAILAYVSVIYYKSFTPLKF